jgi:hypothetical protein
MAYNPPTADFVTSSLSGDITDVATSMTIGTGLDLPAANGILQIDYDSVAAVGAASGPETITYAAYVTGTGAVTGMVRGAAGTTGVTHATGASVQSGMSSEYLQQSPQYDTWNAAGTLTFLSATDTPTFTATITGDSTASIYPGVRVKANQAQAIQNYWSFDATSADSKGGATMANVGTPTYAAGKFSNALTLNGTDQALRITDAASFHLGASGAEFTIGGWVKSSSATGTKTIYASYSDNTNSNGVILSINATVLTLWVGNNAASIAQTMAGTTAVTDGNLHFVVLTFRNNFAQIYLDGKLEVSGYCITPTYAATTYTNIGAYCETSTTPTAGSWFNGQIDDLFIAAYALDEQTIKAKYDAATAQGTGDLTLTKYFLCTASSYSNPNTTVTLYGGTDHSLADSAITAAYYSTQKAPYGFPLGQDKWTYTVRYLESPYKTAPTAGVWYGSTNAWTAGGSAQTMAVPIGNWQLSLKASTIAVDAAALNAAIYVALSKSPSTGATGDTCYTVSYQTITAGFTTEHPILIIYPVSLSAKTTYYVLAMSATATLDTVGVDGANQGSTIKATSTLL